MAQDSEHNYFQIDNLRQYEKCNPYLSDINNPEKIFNEYLKNSYIIDCAEFFEAYEKILDNTTEYLSQSEPVTSQLLPNFLQIKISKHLRNMSEQEIIPELIYDIPTTIILATVFIFLTIITLIGNILVVIAVFTYRPLKSVQNFLIVSLALSDFSVGLIVMPMSTIYNLIKPWILGQFLCKLWLCSDVLFCTSSILNLTAIAIDR